MRMRTVAVVFTTLGLAGGAVVLAQRAGDQQKRRGVVVDTTQVILAQRAGDLPPPAEVISAAPPSRNVPLPDSSPPQPAGAVSEPLPLPDEASPALTPQPVDDPIRDVDAFVAEGHRKADDTIKRLTQEAEMLRARLQKVEMALERWKAVAEALEARPDQRPRKLLPAENAPTDPPLIVPVDSLPSRRKPLPADNDPTDLLPVPVESTPKAKPETH